MGQRKLRNFFIEKDFQLKFSVTFTFFVATLTSLFVMVLSHNILEIRDSVGILENSDPELYVSINQRLSVNLLLGWVAIIFVLFSTFIYTIIVNHAIAGPRFVIKNFIRELTKGNYKARLSLRKNDELHDVMEELEKLRAKLKKD